MRQRIAAAAALVALVLSAAPTVAVTKGGGPDAGEHPYVGQLIFYVPDAETATYPDPGGWFSCSGTLLSSTVVVTAGHCTFAIGARQRLDDDRGQPHHRRGRQRLGRQRRLVHAHRGRQPVGRLAAHLRRGRQPQLPDPGGALRGPQRVPERRLGLDPGNLVPPSPVRRPGVLPPRRRRHRPRRGPGRRRTRRSPTEDYLQRYAGRPQRAPLRGRRLRPREGPPVRRLRRRHADEGRAPAPQPREQPQGHLHPAVEQPAHRRHLLRRLGRADVRHDRLAPRRRSHVVRATARTAPASVGPTASTSRTTSRSWPASGSRPRPDPSPCSATRRPRSPSASGASPSSGSSGDRAAIPEVLERGNGLGTLVPGLGVVGVEDRRLVALAGEEDEVTRAGLLRPRSGSPSAGPG